MQDFGRLQAWSQPLTHEQVMIAFAIYGKVLQHLQAEIIKGLAITDASAAELQDLA